MLKTVGLKISIYGYLDITCTSSKFLKVMFLVVIVSLNTRQVYIFVDILTSFGVSFSYDCECCNHHRPA